MRTSKLLLLAAVGVAVTLLFTTEKGKNIREDISDNADELKNKLSNLKSDASNKLNDLKNVFGEQIEGLTKDARKRILKILGETKDSAKSTTKDLIA